MLRRLVPTIAAVVLLAACGQPNKAADFQDPGTPAQVVTTTSSGPAPTPTASATTAVPVVTKAPTTKATPKPKATTKKPKPKPKATTAEPEEAYYANCTAVRAAGADPIHRGDPGYSRKLDRDGDGVACE